jgi:hypothetical protein
MKDFLAALVIVILLAAFIQASHRNGDTHTRRCDHPQSQEC